MNFEVLDALPRLVKDGVLTGSRADRLERIAAGDLISVRVELRLLLWAGVTLVTSGVGLLVAQNLDRIGPVAVACAIGLAAAVCLAWAMARAVPFSWRESSSPHPAFDYILLLGAMLTASDLAYIEVRFSPLGANWPWHLLITAAFMGVLAFRYDSRMLLSLALTTFAAWRGVTLPVLRHDPFHGWGTVEVQGNAIACGLLYVLLGRLLVRTDRKAHFEPVAAHLGWMLLLLGLMAAMFVSENWGADAVLLLVASGLLTAGAFRADRVGLGVMGVLAAYIALTRLVLELLHGFYPVTLWFICSAAAMVTGLLSLQRRMRGRS